MVTICRLQLHPLYVETSPASLSLFSLVGDKAKIVAESKEKIISEAKTFISSNLLFTCRGKNVFNIITKLPVLLEIRRNS